MAEAAKGGILKVKKEDDYDDNPGNDDLANAFAKEFEIADMT